jgi:hypothetical protein
MALAIKFQNMVEQQIVRDYADLARLGYVSRARLTQIMNLLLLAPDIQEALLESNSTANIRETSMRTICAQVHWEDQRHAFASVCKRTLSKPSSGE